MSLIIKLVCFLREGFFNNSFGCCMFESLHWENVLFFRKAWIELLDILTLPLQLAFERFYSGLHLSSDYWLIELGKAQQSPLLAPPGSHILISMA